MKLFIQRNSLWVLFLPFLMPKATVGQQADQLLGNWLFPTKGSSMIVYRNGNHYFARVDEVDQAGEENFGLIKGAVLIRNLTYDGQGWSGGKLIHPKTGINLSVDVSMDNPQKITVTVYKGLKLFHRKFIMTRKMEQQLHTIVQKVMNGKGVINGVYLKENVEFAQNT